jgi:hypothetical protein
MTTAEKVLRVAFVVVCMAGLVGCVLHLWGGVFYLNPFWYYVPPLSALALLGVVCIRRTIVSTFTAYSLACLFVLSYVLQNWRWVTERFKDEGWFFFPDLAEAIFVLVLLIALHARRNQPRVDR